MREEWAAARKTLLLRLRAAQAKVVELQREKEAGGEAVQQERAMLQVGGFRVFRVLLRWIAV